MTSLDLTSPSTGRFRARWCSCFFPTFVKLTTAGSDTDEHAVVQLRAAASRTQRETRDGLAVNAG